MLYATKFWAPDPFIFLQHNGKRTLVLSDLEIDRGRKQADADEFVMFSELEREVQGKSKKAPPYEKVLAHFLKKRGVRSAIVPANFPLGYAEELAANKIRVRATNGFFWPEREAKSDKEIEMMGRALRITEAGLKRAIEVLKASKPGSGKRLRWNGKTLTSEILRAEIDSAILRAGGVPTEHDRRRRRSGVRSARARLRTAVRGFADHSRCFPARREDRIFWRHDPHGVARARERSAAETLGNGESRPSARAEKNEGRRRRHDNSQSHSGNFSPIAVFRPKCATAGGRIFPRNRPRSRSGNSRVSAVAKSCFQGSARCSRSSRVCIIRAWAARDRKTWCVVTKTGCRMLSRFPKAAGNLNELSRASMAIANVQSLREADRTLSRNERATPLRV